MKRLMIVMFVLMGTLVFAQTTQDQDNLVINAAVNPRATLTISHAAINFADANPDVTASIPATENGSIQFSVRRRGAGGTTFNLDVTVAPDLASGGDTIGIGNVTWTRLSGDTGFNASGTMGVGAAVGTWTGSGNSTANLDFFLANSWAYAVGNYTTTVTYTLTSV